MEKHFDIIVVGGGLNGATLALGAAKIGLRVMVIDALDMQTQTGNDFDGRSYAMALTSVRLMRSLDLWRELADTAQPMLDIKVYDGNLDTGPAPFHLHFDHTEIEEGPVGHMVEDRHLRPVLQNAISAHSGITYLPKTRVTQHETGADKAMVTCDNGETYSASLVIGADGRQSGIAEQAGLKRSSWTYQQTALVCAIDHNLPHHGTAYQYFLPAGPLAILPLQGNRSSIVWTETPEHAAAIMELDDVDYLAVLKPRFGSFLGDIRLAGKRYSYPLGVVLAKDYVAPRVALIGDAAHGIHPIAGQGLNAGLRDIAALCDVLHGAKQRGEDIGSISVLSRYQEWRRFDNQTLALATDTFNKLFSNDNPLIRLGRNLGMGAVNAMPGLRRGFMREAAGLVGDLPRWMQ